MRSFHSFAGLVGAVLVVFMAVTGSLLAFQPIADAAMTLPAAGNPSVAAVVERATQSLPGIERLVRSAGLGEVRMEQAKIPPGRAHGSKGALQRAAMSAFDVFNLPLTRAFNAFGDRVVLTARKPER